MINSLMEDAKDMASRKEIEEAGIMKVVGLKRKKQRRGGRMV
jgi:hypothetical protein